MMHNTLKHWLHVLWQCGAKFQQDDCTYRASALTYTTLLSIVPLLSVTLGILSFLPFFKTISQKVQAVVFSNFIASAGEAVQTHLQHFIERTYALSPISFLFLFVTAILMLFTMEQTFNHIWKVQQRRKGTSAFLLYWAVLTLAPILLGLSISITSYIASLKLVEATVHHLGLAKPFLAATPLLLNTIAFSLIYTIVPNCEVPFKSGLIAGLFAAILFEIAKQLFALYIIYFPTYELLYGALAAIPIFLVWIYISWIIILLGAEFSYAYTQYNKP